MATKTERERSPVSAAQTPDATVVCACANLTLGEIKGLLVGEGGADFDRLLERTGAGKTCTACMLDLEYYFASCRAAAVSPPAGVQSGVPRRSETGAGLKARLYAALDRLSPLVAVKKTEWMPVLTGDRIEQHLLVANHSLLYKQAAAAPLRLGLLVRDAEGVERHREDRILREGETMKVNLSQHLPKPPAPEHSNGLSVGSVVISREALRPGMWGTTRPQVEIVTPGSACVVHSQGPNGQREQWFTCLHRPQQERLFYSVVNVWERPLAVETTCFAGGEGQPPREVCSESMTIPAGGTRLKEISLPPGARVPEVLNVRWRCDGARKIHLFCASPSLDRFSIDHM